MPLMAGLPLSRRIRARDMTYFFALFAKGREKGKNTGKRAGKGNLTDCANETPDGKRICYAFNDTERQCANRKCNFLHVCGKCSKAHPMWSPQCNA